MATFAGAGIGLTSASGDGSKLALVTSSALTPDDTNGRSDVYLLDVASGAVTLQSRSNDGTIGDGASFGAVLSDDGSTLAFTSSSSNLTAGDTDGQRDVFLRDLASGTITNITEDEDRRFEVVDISADGDTVVLRSSGPEGSEAFVYREGEGLEPLDAFLGLVTQNLTADGETYLDGQDPPVELVDTRTGARETLVDASGAVISADGRFVAFETAEALSPQDINGTFDLYVLDLATSQAIAIAPGDGNIATSVIETLPGGAPVVFERTDLALTPDDDNDEADFYAITLDLLAVADEAVVVEGGSATVDVLANDVDFDGDGPRLVAAGAVEGGTAAIDDNGTPGDARDDLLVITAGPGLADGAVVTYEIEDADGLRDTGTVEVRLRPAVVDGPLEVTTAQDVVADDGLLSIREAVEIANARAGEDTITFAEGVDRIELRGREAGEGGLVVTDDLVIDGGLDDGAAGGVTIVDVIEEYRDERGSFREDTGITVLSVTGAELSLNDLTISGGRTGVSVSDATLTAERVSIDDVGAFLGSTGVYADASVVRLVDSAITRGGGSYEPVDHAIRALNGSDVALLRSEVVGNRSYYGRTVEVEGRLTIEDSTFAGNRVFRGSEVIEARGDLEVINSTFVGNVISRDYADRQGAGVIRLDGGAGSILNTTIAGNRIDNEEGPGGTFALGEGVEVRIDNSVVVGNELGDAYYAAAQAEAVGPGSLVSGGNNVFGDNRFDGNRAGDVTGATLEGVFAEVVSDPFNPTRPVLADNGGPTETLALLDDPDNPAIGLADPATAPATDQRGFARDDDPDAGAFEAGAEGGVSPPPPPVDPEGLVVTTGADVVADDGELSLREAVERANVNPGLDTILFAEGIDEVELSVEGGGLEVTDDLVIDGGPDDGGAGSVRLVWQTPSGQTDSDELPDAAFAVDGVGLRLEDLTVTSEDAALGNFGYGPIRGVSARDADLAIVRSAIVDLGSYTEAAGVVAEGGTLLIADSEVRDFNFGGFGPRLGVGLQATGVDARIEGSVFSGSAVAASVDGEAYIARSVFSGDSGVETGAYGLITAGDVVVRDSVVSNLYADQTYASVGMSTSGRLELINSTITGANDGSGLFRDTTLEVREGGYARVVNSTLSSGDRVASYYGDSSKAAVFVDEGGQAYLANSIVTSEGGVGFFGSITSGGGNLFGQDAVAGSDASDVLGADPAAVFATGALADNGGPTPTVALLDDPANPALGQADPGSAPATDQRGFLRDDAPDAGAFELDADDGGVSPPPPPPPPPGEEGLTVTFVSEDADFDNSLGYYLKDEAGAPTGEAGILFEEVSDEALSPGDAATLDLEGVDPAEVGFFLIRDGANLGIDFEGAAFAFDGRGGLFVTEADGETTLLKDYQVQYDFEEGQLIVAVPDEGEGEFLFWEDKAFTEGSYDGDFDDAVFEVRFETGEDATAA